MGEPEAKRMKRTPTELMDLNNDCLKELMKYCDFPSFQVLHRTNHRLQDLTKEVKLKTRIQKICIRYFETKIQLMIQLNEDTESPKFYPNGSKILVNYLKSEEGCSVSLEKKKNNKEKTIAMKNLTYLEAARNDLKSVLGQSDGVLEVFGAHFQAEKEVDHFLQSVEGTIDTTKIELSMRNDKDKFFKRKQPEIDEKFVDESRVVRWIETIPIGISSRTFNLPFSF